VITTQSLVDLVTERNTALPANQRFAIPGLPWASRCAAALEAQRAAAELTTPIRVRHFMAQIAHETGGFRRLVESVAYSKPERLDALFSNVHGIDHAKRLIAEGPEAIGCCIYANKLGNGGIDSGDGFRYRGRGFLMNTGRANYEKVQAYSGLPVVANPDLLGLPEQAAQAAACFWRDNHINAAADADLTDQVTRIVNGSAMEGAANRRGWAEAGKSVWPAAPAAAPEPAAP
jgi:putative chitinase